MTAEQRALQLVWLAAIFHMRQAGLQKLYDKATAHAIWEMIDEVWGVIGYPAAPVTASWCDTHRFKWR